MTAEPQDLINARKAEIAKEMADLDARKVALSDEIAELAMAERVIARLAAARGGLPIAKEAEGQTGDDEGKSIGKPEGLPTMPSLIVTVLRECQRQDIGLEPREILEAIRHRFWPDAPTEAVGPIAWRMWKRNELVKDGSRYLLPQTRFPMVSQEPKENPGAGAPGSDNVFD